MAIFFSSIVTIFLLLSVPVSAQVIKTSPVLERRIERVLREEAFRSGASGLAFGMVQNDRVLLECYAGYSDISNESPLGPHTVFPWGSLSKPLTAICSLHLVDQGKLDLLKPISQERQNTYGGSVSVADILLHRSGIGEYSDYPLLASFQKHGPLEWNKSEIWKTIFSDTKGMKPGERFRYSSPGYILLSLYLERIIELQFEQLLNSAVAKPLQLNSLRVGGVSEFDSMRFRLDKGHRVPVDVGDVGWRLGAGGAYSNLPDALRFAGALIEGTLLSPRSAGELFRRRFNLQMEGETVGVTYGFIRLGVGDAATILCKAQQPGCGALLVIYPHAQMASVIFSNTTPVDLEQIHSRVVRAAASSDTNLTGKLSTEVD